MDPLNPEHDVPECEKSCPDCGQMRALFGEEQVACPQCGATDTSEIAAFGSTSCKSLWRCNACREPFDYFKCH